MITVGRSVCPSVCKYRKGEMEKKAIGYPGNFQKCTLSGRCQLFSPFLLFLLWTGETAASGARTREGDAGAGAGDAAAGEGGRAFQNMGGAGRQLPPASS